MGKNKSQISIFAIVGLLVVLIIGSFLFIKYTSQRGLVDSEGGQAISSKMDQDFLESYISHCVKQTVIEGEKLYGLDRTYSPSRISAYVANALPYCVNGFEEFERQGFTVNAGSPSVTSRISSEVIFTEVEYPVTMSKRGTTLNFDDASYTYPRTVTARLEPGKTTTVVSADGSMILEVPPGTTVTVDGNQVYEVGLKQLDRNFNGLENGVLAGMIAFNGVPHGAVFSQPVKMTYYYEDRDIPIYIKEENLKLGYYEDTTFKNWIGLPTTVDPVKNKLTIETTHFSVYGTVINCGGTTAIKQIVTPTLIQEKCGPCDGWTYQEGNTKIGELYHEKEGIIVDDKDAIPKAEHFRIWNGNGLDEVHRVTGCKYVSILYTDNSNLPDFYYYWPEYCEDFLNAYKHLDVVKCEEKTVLTQEEFENEETCMAECPEDCTSIHSSTTETKWVGCTEDKEYYKYEFAEDLKGRARYEVQFEENGNACFSADSESNSQTGSITLPDIPTPEDAGSAAIRTNYEFETCGQNCVMFNEDKIRVNIAPLCYDDDNCYIKGVHMEESKLVFYIETDSIDSNHDACLTGSAIINLEAAGVTGSYNSLCNEDMYNSGNIVDFVDDKCQVCARVESENGDTYVWQQFCEGESCSVESCLFLIKGDTKYCPASLIGKQHLQGNVCLQCVPSPFSSYYGIWEDANNCICKESSAE